MNHLLTAVGHRDGPASLDSVEEPFLDRVVIERSCNGRKSDDGHSLQAVAERTSGSKASA